MKHALTILALLLAGCATGERVTDLKPGMTKAEVIKTIGQPDGYSAQGKTEYLKYTNKLISGWSWDKADYYAVIENDKLVSWGSGDVRQNRPPVTPVVVYGNIHTY